MARDWFEVVKRIEGHYPLARGGANNDDSLRQLLVPFGNDIIYEINEMQRWSYDYTSTTITTSPGTRTYPMPTGYTVIKKVFFINSTGFPQEIEKRERWEAIRMLGDAEGLNVPPQGTPRLYSLNNRQIELFPSPDSAGFDAGGNYIIYVQGYQLIQPLIETTCTSAAASTTLTAIPDTGYLTTLGLAPTVPAPVTVSVRGAGNVQFTGGGDTYVGSCTAFPSGTTATVTPATPTTSTSNQMVFNSQPWVITWWPKVMLFGILREVSSYFQKQDQFQWWQGRYQQELDLLRAHEYDRMRTLNFAAAAHAQQNAPTDRRIDMPVGLDYRGVV